MTEGVELREPYHDAGAAARSRHDRHVLCSWPARSCCSAACSRCAFVLRLLHPHELVAASKQLHVYIGAINTAVLLTSSLFVALAVQAARGGARRWAAWLLGGAAFLGLAFLALKAFEYSLEYRDGDTSGGQRPWPVLRSGRASLHGSLPGRHGSARDPCQHRHRAAGRLGVAHPAGMAGLAATRNRGRDVGAVLAPGRCDLGFPLSRLYLAR